MQLTTIRRHAPVWLSVFAGLALWEVAGRSTSAAFMVPFSETLVRLWQLAATGEFITQLLDSAELFLTGFGLALIVGAPLGLLLARVRVLRIGIEPYLMILYATPMVALIPFILSLMGFGFVPKVLVVFLFSVFPVLYNTVEGARSIKPELIEVAKSYRSSEWALWREVMLPYTLPYMMTGVRQAIGRALGRHDRGGVLSVGDRPRTAHHGRVAGFRHRRRVRLDPGDRPDRHRLDAARLGNRAALRALETIADGRDQHRCRIGRGPSGAGSVARRHARPAVSCRAC